MTTVTVQLSGMGTSKKGFQGHTATPDDSWQLEAQTLSK
jgi:hypothetical protein